MNLNLDFDIKQSAKNMLSAWIGYELAKVQIPPEVADQFARAIPLLAGGFIDWGYWLVVVRWLKIGLPR